MTSSQTSQTNPPLPQTASIFSLPIEIREQILLYLPIDVHLANVGLASKAPFSPSIFHSIEFARSHVSTDYIRSESDCFGAYIKKLDVSLKKHSHCPHLPLTYQLVLFQKLLESEGCPTGNTEHDNTQPVVGCLHIRTVLTHLLKDPSFDPSCNSFVLLMWVYFEGEKVSMQLAFETFKILFEDGRVDPTENDNHLFNMICANNHAKLVHLFLSNERVRPNANSNEALKAACAFGSTDVIPILLNDPRVDPATVPELCQIALEVGIESSIPFLLKDPRVDPSACNNAAIYEAARCDLASAAAQLLADPRVDPMDIEGRALFSSVTNGSFNVFRVFYADPRVDLEMHGNTVIQNMVMVHEKDVDVLEMLLADEHVDPRAGESEVLRNMAMRGVASAVELLLKDGRVDPAAMNNLALREAASCNRVECVRLLLSDDRVDPLDGGRQCALDLSLQHYDKIVAKMILDDRRVVERRKNFDLTLDAFEMERMELLEFLFQQDGFRMGGLPEMDNVDWTPLFVFQNSMAVMTHCSKFLSGGIHYHESSSAYIKVAETMFGVLNDPLVEPKTKFRAILNGWESLRYIY
ncbi:hypothetical protein HDU99_000625 [Rhizoclosmatium hyalinum]|nr:hypothetical protein HDU99_000625 [Rhizoclosmatium hyalinum]